MADPFEVRMKFSHQLGHLGASTTSAQKAAHYALRHKDLDEDLHSCIIENVERNTMNNRANIMYFLEPLCDMAKREGHVEMIRMVQRDILRIIDAVAPADGSGAANVKVVRKVLGGLQQKHFLTPETVVELEECLKDRDTNPAHPAMSPSRVSHGKESSPTGMTYRPSGAGRVEKRQAEQRIEEDRERHKRLRESIWAVQPDKEFDKLWEDASDIGEDDFTAALEDAAERKRAEIAVD